jgi:GTPase SAR1 family protein
VTGKKKRQISVALIGEPGVGKTTIVKLIRRNIESHGTTYDINTDAISYTFWELQTSSSEPERLAVFSTSFLKQSVPYQQYLFIVSDSSKEDVDKITFSIDYLGQMFTKTRLVIVANKQDLENRLTTQQIEKIARLPTLEVSAINEAHRERLLNFISYLIDSDTGL